MTASKATAMPATRKFRTMLQELWMTRMQNKPHKRIQTIAKALRKFAGPSSLPPHSPPLAAGLSLTSTRVPGQTNGTKPHTHVVSNTSHVNHTRATDNTRDGTDVPLNWVFGSSALSEHAAVNHSEWRHVEQLRRKVREAMNSAARRTLLDSLSRTADAPPLPHPSAVHYTDTTHGALASSSWAGPTRTGDVHGVSPSASLPHFRSATKDDRAEAAGPPTSSHPDRDRTTDEETEEDNRHHARGAGGVEWLYHRVKDRVRVTRQYYNNVPFDERWDDIRRSLAVLGRLSTGNTVKLYTDSSIAFTDMWGAIDAAKEEVLWQTYICKDDHVGRTTVHKMAQARQRGCARVELIYDCGGNISGRARLTEELRRSGGTVIGFRPFFRGFVHYVSGGLDWRISPGLRNHRKILLVDRCVGFCGGLNIGNAYCGQDLGGSGKFKDTHCAVRGPALAHLREVYDNTTRPQLWKYTWQRWRQIASSRWGSGGVGGSDAGSTGRPANGKTAARTSAGRATHTPSRAVVDGTETEKEGGGTLRKTRWRRQQDRLRALMRWNNKPSDDRHDASPTAGEASDSAESTVVDTSQLAKERKETTDSGALASNRESLLSTSHSSWSSSSSTRAGGGPQHVESLRIDTGKDNPVGVVRTGVMRRKIREAREGALDRVRALSHKRFYTRLLREIAIADEEPVPEAEVYSQRSSPSTQILLCHPRYSDYGIQYAFWQVARKCHRRLWLTTPYFLPTRKLFKALLHAAQRGVDVRILTGSQHTTDPWFMWHASNYIVERLLKGGVRVFEYKGQQVMHGKTLVVDSIWSSIGSYNWDILSNKNLEVCLCQLDTALAREMERNFLSDISLSDEIALDGHQQRSLWLRFTSWLFYNAVYVINRLTFFSYVNEDVEDRKH